ncbi:unnamed protein product [Candidula unifasciata]|uniref:Uncharacterized protein n=1 Tax=Candidula unifasciata TaxID=100452 RepID=A0A8S3ZHX1_9EUPU|nr:unnamed protein product [Candidula unifasciata]
MPCSGASLCPTSPDQAYNYSLNEVNYSWTTNSSLPLHTETILGTHMNDAASRHHINAMFKGSSIALTLSFCVLVSLCSTSVLLATHWMNSYRSVTFVFLRSLYVSDILMSIYGTSKMTMLLFIEQLNINFFLPESLFFTASLASTMSLIFINLDCYLKLARPLQYKQVNIFKHVTCIVSVRHFHTLPKLDFNCFSSRMVEIQNYTYFHGTIILESVLWLCCYLPFFIYIVLTCSQCLLSDFTNRDFAVIYFIPLFMTKSLLSSVLQMGRTFQAYDLISSRISGSSIFKRLKKRRQMRMDQKHSDVTPISFSNPLCEYNNFSSHGDIQVDMDHTQAILHPRSRVMEFVEFIQDTGCCFSSEGSSTSLAGFTNSSYRASISSKHADVISQQTTTL